MHKDGYMGSDTIIWATDRWQQQGSEDCKLENMDAKIAQFEYFF